MATCAGTDECECDETECPRSENLPPLGPSHCEHWYDNKGCHWCGDPPCAVQTRIEAEEDANHTDGERLGAATSCGHSEWQHREYGCVPEGE